MRPSPAGPQAADEADKVLTRFLLEVYDRRHPRTDATGEQFIGSAPDASLGFKTWKNYRSQAPRRWSHPARQNSLRLATYEPDSADKARAPQPVELEVRRLGVPIATLCTRADPSDS